MLVAYLSTVGPLPALYLNTVNNSLYLLDAKKTIYLNLHQETAYANINLLKLISVRTHETAREQTNRFLSNFDTEKFSSHFNFHLHRTILTNTSHKSIILSSCNLMTTDHSTRKQMLELFQHQSSTVKY
jgi:hypothetical protein